MTTDAHNDLVDDFVLVSADEEAVKDHTSAFEVVERPDDAARAEGDSFELVPRGTKANNPSAAAPERDYSCRNCRDCLDASLELAQELEWEDLALLDQKLEAAEAAADPHGTYDDGQALWCNKKVPAAKRGSKKWCEMGGKPRGREARRERKVARGMARAVVAAMG